MKTTSKTLNGLLVLTTVFAFTGLTQAYAQNDTAERQKVIDQLKSTVAARVTDKVENEANDLSDDSSQPEIEGALQLNARSYAADVGVSEREAARRLKMQERLGKVISLIEQVNPDRFAGAWIEHKPEYRVVVRLAGDKPVESWQNSMMVADTVPVVMKTGARATLQQLLDTVAAATPEIKKTLPELSGTEVDVKTGEIVLFVEQVGDGIQLRQSVQGRLAETRSPAIGELLNMPLRIEEVDAPVTDGHTRGGADLSSCTSGFVVQHPSTGTTGYITAGHCPDSQTYFEFGGTSYSTTFIDEIRDADQDVQWHTTSHIEYPHFYASSTSTYRGLTSSTSRSSMSVGGYACHRGKTTGYSCGYIDSTTFQPTYTNACNGVTCASVWIRVSGGSLECFPGDSGGPWFIAYSAYGIYKGQSSSGTTSSDCNWAFYMASDYFGIDLLFDN